MELSEELFDDLNEAIQVLESAYVRDSARSKKGLEHAHKKLKEAVEEAAICLQAFKYKHARRKAELENDIS